MDKNITKDISSVYKSQVSHSNISSVYISDGLYANEYPIIHIRVRSERVPLIGSPFMSTNTLQRDFKLGG